ncbi:hypothetical protein BRADI_2g31737v3 [Brachypodium distachyon]|uniref:Uncharacterized protein n=1 Tax=Brachypodium distachyon TaxID=15368 RepID=A0A2K2DBD9_BRADI|nr:hypothetical protein BRADI_2g31737v3 [Brachypodium distachyon]PNT71585.1 hypothetical protein BRADI_2g31737v3 [Brachypodium distachyon]
MPRRSRCLLPAAKQPLCPHCGPPPSPMPRLLLPPSSVVVESPPLRWHSERTTPDAVAYGEERLRVGLPHARDDEGYTLRGTVPHICFHLMLLCRVLSFNEVYL